jgi:putative copper export protein
MKIVLFVGITTMVMLLANALIMWAHLVAASIWVGGSIFIGIVLAPLLKTFSDSVEGRLSIMIRVGRKFNKIGVPSLIILIITGIYNSAGIIVKPSVILDTNYGIVLLIKIILVITLIIIFAIHIRLIRSEVERKIESRDLIGDHLQKLRSKIIMLGRLTVIISILILLMAALLHSGV